MTKTYKFVAILEIRCFKINQQLLLKFFLKLLKSIIVASDGRRWTFKRNRCICTTPFIFLGKISLYRWNINGNQFSSNVPCKGWTFHYHRTNDLRINCQICAWDSESNNARDAAVLYLLNEKLLRQRVCEKKRAYFEPSKWMIWRGV